MRSLQWNNYRTLKADGNMAMIDSPVVDVKPPQTEDNDQPVDEPEVEDEPGIETSANPTLAPSPTKAQEKPSQKAEAEDDSKEVINLFGSKPTFMMPVEGKIGMDYAMDRLLYSKTLDEWRTHSGIDITAPRGEVVKAVADGYVKEIKEDPCYGITIILDHEMATSRYTLTLPAKVWSVLIRR